MNPRSATLEAKRTQLPFSLWGWLMLVVIMLSAAPTGGALRSQVFGSAFDPATYSVTTAPKRHSLSSELQTENSDEPEEAPSFDYPLHAHGARALASATIPRPDSSPSMLDRGTAAHLIADNRAARAPPV